MEDTHDKFTGMPVMTDSEGQRQRLWTVEVTGGEALILQVTTGPALEHDGGYTLWKSVLTGVQMKALGDLLVSKGARVAVHCQQETEDLKQQREINLGMTEDFSWQCDQCPFCFFYTPATENACGLDDWNPAQLEAARKIEKAVKDEASCPLREERQG